MDSKSDPKDLKKKQESSGGLIRTLSFILPSLWRCEWKVRFSVVLTIVMMLLAKMLNAIPPLILKYIIDGVAERHIVFYLIFLYAGIKQLADVINKLRDVVWAPVAANAEVYVENILFNHLMKQSLSYHVARETGKVISICSKGANSFAQVLRALMFLYTPLACEIGFI
jgi:ATP-binding cassette subfamily B protein